MSDNPEHRLFIEELDDADDKTEGILCGRDADNAPTREEATAELTQRIERANAATFDHALARRIEEAQEMECGCTSPFALILNTVPEVLRELAAIKEFTEAECRPAVVVELAQIAEWARMLGASLLALRIGTGNLHVLADGEVLDIARSLPAGHPGRMEFATPEGLIRGLECLLALLRSERGGEDRPEHYTIPVPLPPGYPDIMRRIMEKQNARRHAQDASDTLPPRDPNERGH